MVNRPNYAETDAEIYFEITQEERPLTFEVWYVLIIVYKKSPLIPGKKIMFCMTAGNTQLTIFFFISSILDSLCVGILVNRNSPQIFLGTFDCI